MPSRIFFLPVFFSALFLILATPLLGIPMERESAEKQQASAEASAAKACRATEEGGTEIESSALAKRGTKLHVTEKREAAPNTGATMGEQVPLDSSFSNEDDEAFLARLAQNQTVMDSLPNTSAASAIFQEESQILFGEFQAPSKESQIAVKESFNGVAISQTELPAQKLGASKLSLGNRIAQLMALPGLPGHMTSFLMKDPKVSEYEAKENQLFQELKTKYPNQLRACSSWEDLSHEKQVLLEAALPPGALEPLKGTLLAQKIIEAASKIIKGGAIEKIRNSFPQGIEKENEQIDFLSKELPEQTLSTNLTLERMEVAARSVAQLGRYKGDVLQYAARAREEGRDGEAAEFETISTSLETAMKGFHAFAETSDTGNTQEATQFYNRALSETGTTLKNFYNLQSDQARAAGTPESLIKAENLNKAAEVAFMAYCNFDNAKRLRASGNEKEVQALEQAGDYNLQSAQAFALGTPESLIKAQNLREAAKVASSACGFFDIAQQARASGDEKKAQAYEQTGDYYLQSAQARAAGTPESLIKAENLNKAADVAWHACCSFNDAKSERVSGSKKAAQALEQTGDYYLQSAQARAAGTPGSLIKAENLREVAEVAQMAGFNFNSAQHARANGDEKAAQVKEQQGEFCLDRAEIYATKGKDAGDAFTFEEYQARDVQDARHW